MTPSCQIENPSVGTPQNPTTREERGRQIAKRGGIRRSGSRYTVPSQEAGGTTYTVDLVDQTCTCPDWETRRRPCKHQEAVLFSIVWDGAPDEPSAAQTPPKRKNCPRDWSVYNRAQASEGIYVARLLRALCQGLPQPPRKPGRGRNPVPLADQAFSAVLKVYSLKAQRYMESALANAVEQGLVDRIYHYNTISNFLGDEASTAILVGLVQESAKPLAVIEAGQFAIDSTGFSTVTYDRWFDQKHGKLCAEHTWVKLHIAVGTVTHAITGVAVTPKADCPQLPSLLTQTMKNFQVSEMSADKAYSSKANHRILESCGVEAYIPFQITAAMDPKCETWSRHLAEFLFNQDKFLPHYHRRSNVESVMWMIKSKFGASVRSKTPVAQMNEVLAKCLCHNLACLVQAIFTAGLAPRFWQDVPARDFKRVPPVASPSGEVME